MQAPLSLSDLLVLGGGLMMFSAAIEFVIRLGGKLDRLSDAIEYLAGSLEAHESRLRRLEGLGK